MGQVLYFGGIVLFVLGILGLVLFGNERVAGQGPNYGRWALWLAGAGVVLFVVGYLLEL